ncbi:Methyltransferase small [uncultured delta proteobacterium]|uniref:Methyltransferase small n=1 Tax=uncultured delta proteobacterium TaxID=34034 RepID=A0A212JPN7_9DELT|nr:Methyltransferase small [uncultured delta proteobacterium]
MTDAVYSARAYFPRGLAQPPGSFRFSADALLLASFALRHCLPETGGTVLDLGCGCGVVALACLLGDSRLQGAGVDAQPDLVAAARENAVRLGLERVFTAAVMDLAATADRERLAKGGYSPVLANMPFRASGSGRLPRDASRRKALFADEATMPAFLAAAKHALAPDGSFALIYPWDNRERLLHALEEHGFAPVALLPVRTGTPDGARCCIRAVHAHPGSGGVTVLPPLVLRAGKGGPYTGEAIAFCPWLAEGAGAV